MTSLVFLLTAVAVIAAIALLAVGRLGELPPTPDSRAALKLPPGQLGPSDLRQIKFGIVFRGYRMSEVDEVMSRLIEAPQGGDCPDGGQEGR